MDVAPLVTVCRDYGVTGESFIYLPSLHSGKTRWFVSHTPQFTASNPSTTYTSRSNMSPATPGATALIPIPNPSGKPKRRRTMPKMQSTHYYTIPYPNSNYGASDGISKPDCSIAKTPATSSSGRTDRPDPLEAFVSGRLKIIEDAIEQVSREIAEREALRDSMLHAIDKAMCDQKELLFQVAPHGSSPFTVGDSRRRSSIEKELATLEGEKRRETTSAWKDIAGLRRELRELIMDRDSERRRQQVVQP